LDRDGSPSGSLNLVRRQLRGFGIGAVIDGNGGAIGG
jgi:hypothetical protein